MSSALRTLTRARFLGVAGSLLLLVSLAPDAGPILLLVGWIFILMAVRDISEITGDRPIYTNMRYAVGLAIVGAISAILLIVSAIFSLIGTLGLTKGLETPGFPFPGGLPDPATFLSFFVGIILGLVVIWIIFLASALFLRRSFNSMASRLNVEAFKTASLLYLIGAGLTIVLVGFILIFIAEVYMVMAFSSIEEKSPSSQPTG